MHIKFIGPLNCLGGGQLLFLLILCLLINYRQCLGFHSKKRHADFCFKPSGLFFKISRKINDLNLRAIEIFNYIWFETKYEMTPYCLQNLQLIWAEWKALEPILTLFFKLEICHVRILHLCEKEEKLIKFSKSFIAKL